jgi:hypothetical protein
MMRRTLEIVLEAWRTSKGINSSWRSIKFRISESDFNPTWSPGTPYITIDAHDVYEIRFGRSTYAQKEDEITFSMTLVSSPTKIGFEQNYQNKFNF